MCEIGILGQVQAAVHGLHLRTAARYSFCGAYAKRHVTLDIDLPFCLFKKRELASSRRKRRRNGSYPFLSQLEEDLKKMSFGPESRQLVTELSCHPRLADSVRRVVEALGGVDRGDQDQPSGADYDGNYVMPARAARHNLRGPRGTTTCACGGESSCKIRSLKQRGGKN